MINHNEKVVLITGATRGIGKAITKKFASEGYRLVLVYRSNIVEAQKTESELKQFDSEILMLQADLSCSEDCLSVVNRAIEYFGQIDVLVNNAGITSDGAFALMKPKEYSSVISSNSCAPVLLSMYAMPYLIESANQLRNGAIVMMSSIAGIVGKEGQVPYSTTKGSLIGSTRLLARQYGNQGVRVNAIAPGFIETDMVEELDPKMYNHVLEAGSLPRMGKPNEVADAVWFLANKSSSYVNGQVIRIDGGFLR